MRRGLLLVVLVASACGGGGDANDGGGEPETAQATTAARDGSGAIPAAEYARELDRLCARVARDAAEFQPRLQEVAQSDVPEPEQMERAAAILEEQLAVVREFRRDVAAVGLPDEHAEDARRLVEKTRQAEHELARGIRALRSGDAGTANESLQRYAGLSLQTASIARDSELPFAVCGAGA